MLLASCIILRIKAYLCHGVFNHFLVAHVALVAYQQFVDTLGGIAVNLLQPLLDIVEGVHVCNVVDDTDAMSAAVVRGGNGTEPFLTSSIPLGELS